MQADFSSITSDKCANGLLAQPYYVPVLLNNSEANYPHDITTYVNSIASQIGGETTWAETTLEVYYNFAATGALLQLKSLSARYSLLSGDWMRNSRSDLEAVIDAGVCDPFPPK